VISPSPCHEKAALDGAAFSCSDRNYCPEGSGKRSERVADGGRRSGKTAAQAEYPVRFARSARSAGLEPLRVYMVNT